MRLTSALIVLCAATLLITSCFYDPDEEKIDLLHPAIEIAGGYGAECTSDADCAQNEEATYCATDPTKPEEPGGCTRKDCIVGTDDDCPDGYTCCDCPAMPPYTSEQMVACTPDDEVTQLQAFCDCE